MTLIAGMYVLKSDKRIDPQIVDLLKRCIARTEGKIDTYVDERFALVKWDSEAFRVPGFLDDEEGVTAITGEPYWEGTRTDSYSRLYDLGKISEQLRKANINILTACHGSYSVCHYEKSERRLILAVDKLGVRPIYYLVHENILFFASAIRIFESMEFIPKRFNLPAFVEKRVFGVALGTNTKYCDVKVLRDGQYIVCDGSGVKLAFYFRWEEIVPSNKELESIEKDCYKAFRDAVSIRSSRDSRTFAFLSGGLDSRCVVSVLNDIGKKVIAFNFSLPGEKDDLYGKKYADRLGIEYYPEHRPLTNWSIWELISHKLLSIDQDTLKQLRWPRLIFSGDGGSVGMGHVYLSDALLREYKNGGRESAIDFFLSGRNLPDRIFKRQAKEIIRRVPRDSLVRELSELSGVAPGRDFYLFLLRNDQRRHLHDLWESIDIARVEFLEPFYDARLLSVVASAPIEPFIGHRFYYDWLNLFPADAKSVPWQGYPGHVPCPIATNDESVSQWDNYQKVQQMSKDETYQKCKNVLFRKSFPYYLVNRFIIYAAIVAYKLNLRDVAYIFGLVNSLYTDHSKCSNTQIEMC
jgi:asparagine synthase (glutamine-hydrolysing)